nr:hypothetical protein [Bacilli bacterium]
MNEVAKNIVETKIKKLRSGTPIKEFNNNKLAEVEINKFFYNGSMIDRVMVVLRANGCEHYKTNGGCSMCAHYNGTSINNIVTDRNYKKQWDSVLDGTGIEKKDYNFNIDNFPVVCIYNLGSFLNVNEISLEAAKYIFSKLNEHAGVKKAIIESRAEYINDETINNIKSVYSNTIEVGIGVESTNNKIRELCHHKGLDDLKIIKTAVEILHKYNCKALAYINLKPVFLTEQEAIDDAIQTCLDCIEMGFDAISIEPTSLQEHSLANYMYEIGEYRVPWLWSIRDILNEVYKKTGLQSYDFRIGGYFDEEVLSGSQGVGFEGKNELFPHLTSSNCSICTPNFVNKIKEFNCTYDIACLNDIQKCEHCYSIWEETKKIKDSRKIEQRIIDVLGDDYANKM